MADVPPSLVHTLADLDRFDDSPLYQQLYRGLRQGIVDGRIAPDTRLPSTRTLAEYLGVSRNTVSKAFDLLRTEGYLSRHVGSGTYVSGDLPEKYTRARVPEGELSGLRVADAGTRSLSLSDRSRRLANAPLSGLDDPTQRRPFRPGVPALDAFPIETWSTLVSRRWKSLPEAELVHAEPAGYPPLREAVAEYVRDARGVRCDADQVLIVNGVQQAFTLVARVLLNPDDVVCVEDPGFPQMAAAFRAVGAHVRSVPVDDQGLTRPQTEVDGPPRMVGVTPSHQFPLGITMTLSRRIELLEWANRTDAWILEDDYNSEFRYSRKPFPALQGLDNAGRVLYAGTFSKLMFPSLRLGYLVGPPDLVEPLTKMRYIADRGSSRVNQMAMTDFITEGHFRRHIRRMRTLYATRQGILLDAMDRALDAPIDVVPGDAGLHLIGWVPEEIDDRAVSDHLARHDLVAPPLSFYSTRPLERGGLLLGYGGFTEEEIRAGARKMNDALASFSW